MTDESTPTNYGDMFQTAAEPASEVNPAAPIMTDRVFGATSIVDGISLIYDETNGMWVYAENHDEPWLGAEPTVEPPILAVEPVPDSSDTFVSVNIDGGGNLRLREDASVNGTVVGLIPNETALKVINADNPDWTFVEYANGDNEPLRGYVKGSLVVETPAQ